MTTLSLTPSEILPLISKVSPFIKRDYAFPNSEHITIDVTENGCSIHAGTTEARVSFTSKDIRNNTPFLGSAPAKKLNSLLASHPPSSMFSFEHDGEEGYLKIAGATSKYRVRSMEPNSGARAVSQDANEVTLSAQELSTALKQALVVMPYANPSAPFQACVFLVSEAGRLRVMSASSALAVIKDLDTKATDNFKVALPFKTAQMLAEQLNHFDGSAVIRQSEEQVNISGSGFLIEVTAASTAPFDPSNIRLSQFDHTLELNTASATTGLGVANSIVASEVDHAVRLQFNDTQAEISMPDSSSNGGTIELEALTLPSAPCSVHLNPKIIGGLLSQIKADSFTMEISGQPESPVRVISDGLIGILSPVRLR